MILAAVRQGGCAKMLKKVLRLVKWIGGVASLMLLFLNVDLFARDIQSRLGLGYNAEFSNAYSSGYRLPGVSLKYGVTRDIAIEGIVGISTASPTNSVTAFKFFKNLFFENNLNFYSTVGLGLLSVNGQSGLAFLAGFGAEFFIPGVDSLGLSVETGVTFDNGTGNYSLKTLGVSFLDAGIHFYF